jgi:hypothetical protein
MAGELFQFIMELFLQHDINLVRTFGNNGDGFVYIARFCLDLGHVLGFKIISYAVSYLPA